MYLIQILLPLYSPRKELFPESFYDPVKKELTDKFGGITAYSRSPATGLWKENEDKTVKDDIIIYEIMAEELERDWWKSLKKELEERFEQEAIIVRASNIDLL